MKSDIFEEYFDWMYDLVAGEVCDSHTSYRELLSYLHRVPFRAIIPMDKNRLEDGIALRFRFGMDIHKGDFYAADMISERLTIDDKCSVLEMMIALCLRCEENIMDNALIGNRTVYWFWMMIGNLGLNGMTDDRFDLNYAKDCVYRFLNRDYDSDGKGGLVYIPGIKKDLRNVEIWVQLLWYLDTIE